MGLCIKSSMKARVSAVAANEEAYGKAATWEGLTCHGDPWFEEERHVLYVAMYLNRSSTSKMTTPNIGLSKQQLVRVCSLEECNFLLRKISTVFLQNTQLVIQNLSSGTYVKQFRWGKNWSWLFLLIQSQHLWQHNVTEGHCIIYSMGCSLQCWWSDTLWVTVARLWQHAIL
jgi:hypothetical protein